MYCARTAISWVASPRVAFSLTGAPDYELPIFQFNVPPALQQTWYGIAFDNHLSPPFTSVFLPKNVQNFVFTSTTLSLNAFYGHGQILEHEVGHHLGFSHPLMDTCASPMHVDWESSIRSETMHRLGSRWLATTSPGS